MNWSGPPFFCLPTKAVYLPKKIELMDEKQCVELLERHGIRPTANRIMIVKALAAEQAPKTVKDLEDTLVLIDKSNIFRALTIFKEQHLVHSIEDGNGAQRYELCLSHSDDEDDDEHVHFFCEECGRTFCLHSVPLPAVPLPAGYRARSANYLVKGLCPECARKLRK